MNKTGIDSYVRYILANPRKKLDTAFLADERTHRRRAPPLYSLVNENNPTLGYGFFYRLEVHLGEWRGLYIYICDKTQTTFNDTGISIVQTNSRAFIYFFSDLS